ncbi:MAG: SpoIIE family protein phosphatase [SAR324 cluster bacterium]|nr:SpoIIE family protein phosphatase [SAR324 cluster bacterium]
MDQNKPKILVVDDESFNIGVLHKNLEQDYKIIAAKNGVEAVRRATKYSPDLILLDIMMPKMDGYEVCRQLKSNEQTQDIAVIFLSAKNELEDEKKGLGLGAVDYITKPFSVDIVKARIKTHLALRTKTRELAEKNEELIEDLKTAAAVQRHLSINSPIPPFLKMAIRYLPHSHVSGDLYKLYSNSTGGFNIFIGDSTGHGVAAALTTIMVDILLNQHKNETPVRTMEFINEVLEKQLPNDRFLSAALVQITLKGKIYAITAGHPPLIIIPANSNDPVLLSSQSPILGTFTHLDFTAAAIHYSLQSGDRVFLYTDGITERCDGQGNMFKNRLVEFLKNQRDHDLDSLLTLLLEHINAFAEAQPPDDDMTLVAFEYLGQLANNSIITQL